MSDWYPVGTASARARSLRAQRSVGIAQIVFGAVWVVPLGLIIERQEDRGLWGVFSLPTLGWSLLVVGIVGGMWRAFDHFSRRRIRENGSFYFITSIPPDRERDRQRVERSIRRAGGTFDIFSDYAHVSHPVSGGDDFASQIRQLSQDIEYALRPDDSRSPTNVVTNLSWPAAVAAGCELMLRANRSPSLTALESVRIWYLLDANALRREGGDRWYKRHKGQWLGGELIDCMSLPSLVAGADRSGPLEGSHRVLSLEFAGSPEQPSLERFLTDFDLTGSEVLVAPPSSDANSGPRFQDPSAFEEQAVGSAALIMSLVERSTPDRPGVLFARAAKSTTFAIGLVLGYMATRSDVRDPLERLVFANWDQGADRFVPWRYIANGQPMADS